MKSAAIRAGDTLGAFTAIEPSGRFTIRGTAYWTFRHACGALHERQPGVVRRDVQTGHRHCRVCLPRKVRA